MSHWLAGLDEAGYGPKLGPMVIGCVTLESETRIDADSPWDLLSPLIGPAGRRDKNVISVADSKRLHRPGTGDLSRLEEGVLSFIAAERGAIPKTFRQLIDHCTSDRSNYLDEYPWYQGQDLALPYSCSQVNLAGKVRRLERSLDRCAITRSEVRAIPLEVQEFNSQVKKLGTKGAVDAWAMGRFFSWLWKQPDRKQVEIWSDRLGGRERYGPLLYPLFPGCSFKILEQDKDCQSYRATMTKENRVVEVHFRKECEQFSFCTALASMTAKYLRELHMVLLNRYWADQIPDIKPTAGYPQDAGRFIGEVEGIRRQLGIDSGLLVRSR